MGGPASSGRCPSSRKIVTAAPLRASAHHRSTPPITGSIDATAEIDVGDHAALTHRRHRLQVRERRIAVVHPVGPGAAVGHHVHAELAPR